MVHGNHQKREVEQPRASAFLVGGHCQDTGLLHSQLLSPLSGKNSGREECGVSLETAA